MAYSLRLATTATRQATPLPSGNILDKIIVLSFFNFIRIFAPDKAESTSVESLWPLVGACLAWVWAPLMWAKEVAEIAQSVEHFTRNEKVSGSSPDFGSRWTTQNFKPLRPFGVVRKKTEQTLQVRMPLEVRIVENAGLCTVWREERRSLYKLARKAQVFVQIGKGRMNGLCAPIGSVAQLDRATAF